MQSYTYNFFKTVRHCWSIAIDVILPIVVFLLLLFFSEKNRLLQWHLRNVSSSVLQIFCRALIHFLSSLPTPLLCVWCSIWIWCIIVLRSLSVCVNLQGSDTIWIRQCGNEIQKLTINWIKKCKLFNSKWHILFIGTFATGLSHLFWPTKIGIQKWKVEIHFTLPTTCCCGNINA